MQSHVEFLITDSLNAAVSFGRMIGWDYFSGNEMRKPNGVAVFIVRPGQHEKLFGHRKAVCHVGFFAKTREGNADRRHLMNVAENRGIHLIPYDLDGEKPEPLRICLICGSTVPCLWKEDLQPNEPGVPCTFDPTIPQLVTRLRIVEQENAQIRHDLDTITTDFDTLKRGFAALWSEIQKIERALKAYRSPAYDAAPADREPRSGGQVSQNVLKRPRG